MKAFLSGITLCFLCLTSVGQEQNKRVQQLSASEFKAQLTQAQHPQLIDVRTPGEYNEGHLRDAVNMDIHNTAFKEEVASLDKTKPVYVYCLGGGRSAAAATLLAEQGFADVRDMKGGIMAWKNAGLAVSGAPVKETTDQFTSADFDHLLAANPVILVDFYADWCLPCKKMEPMLNRLTTEYEGKVRIYRLNVEKAKALTAVLKVEGIPVFQLYRQGKLIRTVSGEQDEKSIRAMLDAGL